jgi:hypothetical protein
MVVQPQLVLLGLPAEQKLIQCSRVALCCSIDDYSNNRQLPVIAHFLDLFFFEETDSSIGFYFI